MAAHKEDLVSALESSLQTCVSLLLVTDNLEKDGEKMNVNKSGVDASIIKFLEAAKSLEADFLRKQMYSRVNHPQEVTKEEVDKMRAELAQKEELLTRTREKVAMWANRLQDLETRQTRLQLADIIPQRTVSLDPYSLEASRK
ncbi:mediator of RNA polymerase II transcription subunit 28-like [Orbicella faveolata]|uniref:mediator of RNA polymerase II transcription subunit 28-like n=1 Tax=Orbicella faveolata TaxID=48498 RepID=UPI0009E36EBC|nr:mediator of RNA polymerase II transcription subunit 28-like [Orbicella faveolata]